MKKRKELFTVVGRQGCDLKDDNSPNSKLLKKKISSLLEPHINPKDRVVSDGFHLFPLFLLKALFHNIVHSFMPKHFPNN